MNIKVGFCVAYDWKLLQYSLPAIYPVANQICLSVDRNNRSWNGNEFEIDKAELREFIVKIDTEKKVKILEESFYNPALTPIENECYQRKRMANYLGKADWIVQLDADEIILNVIDFVKTLERYKSLKRPVNIHGVWINLIKQTSEGFIYSVLKTPPLASNVPQYEYGRTNGYFNIYTNIFLAHITWARDDEEVFFKLNNWGHSHEFNGMSFYKIWKALDDYNWRYIRDFHPMGKVPINQLFYQPARTIEEFKANFSIDKHLLKRSELAKNNIWISRIQKLVKKIRN